jgi:hypothetical protein
VKGSIALGLSDSPFFEKAGGCEIIAGDINGTVTSFQQHDALWKMNVAEESAKLATLGMVSKLFVKWHSCF